METRKFTQFGTFSVAILLPLSLLFSGLMIRSGLTNSPDFYILIFLALTFLVCLLIFYKLTIIIDDKSVSFKLGIGLVGKTYKITDLRSCRPVTNTALAGVGIRMLPNGWLYNVTGLDAIELQFRNKNSVIRIGTNRPEEISEIIQTLIGGRAVTGESIEEHSKKRINPVWVITLLLVSGLVIIPNYVETRVSIGSNEFLSLSSPLSYY